MVYPFFLERDVDVGKGSAITSCLERSDERKDGRGGRTEAEGVGTGGGDSPVSGTCVPCWEGWKRISRGSVVYVGRQKHATPDTRRDDDARAMPKPAHIVAGGSREAMPHVGVVLSHLPAHLVRPHQPLISSCPA